MDEETITNATVVDEQPASTPAALAVREPEQGAGALAVSFGKADPVERIDEAARVATKLKDVLTQGGMITGIQGREHVMVEGWQTLGVMAKVFPVKEFVRAIDWPDPVPAALKDQHEKGLTFGYAASFNAITPEGIIVGSGEAECKRTEGTWKSRDDFALKSMAQTRATSRCLKAPLGFVMSMAGYSATPAEEIPRDEEPTVEIPTWAQAAPPELQTAAKEALMGILAEASDPEGDARRVWKGTTDTAGGFLPRIVAETWIEIATPSEKETE